mgnify:CR=1 FL=1
MNTADTKWIISQYNQGQSYANAMTTYVNIIDMYSYLSLVSFKQM